MNAPEKEPKPKRGWFRFSLRTLLLLVTVAGGGFSWFGYKVRQVERQSAAVEAIRSQGGYVVYDYQLDSGGNIDFRAIPPGPEWLRALAGNEFFANVVLVGFGVETTDGGLDPLKGFDRLERLYLNETQVTDTGLAKLKGLKQLKILGLSSTRVTDAGLVHLEGLDRLELLWLAKTQVTDVGLPRFRGLTQLRNLDLHGTDVTDAECEELQKALPNLTISR